MRKVIAGLFITIDGVIEEPSSWQETFDEDMGAFMTSYLSGIDTILLGRVTYQYWEPYWSTFSADSDDMAYADFINHTPKYVVSRTLNEVKWGTFGNAALIGDLVEGVGALKAQPGNTIGVQGSPTLVDSLLQHDLLDELSLVIHNVAVYKGARLFKDGGDLKRFDLIDVNPTRTGVIIATYRPRRA
jgi:dihydrofolate reductase